MLTGKSGGFELDRRLDATTVPVMWLSLCELRLVNDRRWPWLMLVPQRPNAVELHDLTPLDQTMLVFETNLVAQMLKTLTGCHKINSGALGNVVPQLHMHVVARNQSDPGWPGPVWGFGEREPYRAEDRHSFAENIRNAMSRANS